MRWFRTRRQDLAARIQRAREWENALHTYAAALTERDAAHNARERALNAREQALTGHPARRDWGAAVRAAHYEQQQQARP